MPIVFVVVFYCSSDATVHPATWFKVLFDDGKVFTFRPSALMPVNGNDDDSSSPVVNKKQNDIEVQPNKKQKLDSVDGLESKRHAEDADDDISTTESDFPDNSTPSTGILLSTLDPDTWEGILVKIKGGGKFQGLIGKVLRSGNGWVQLDCRSSGEIAKRAYELELMVQPPANAQLATPTTTTKVSSNAQVSNKGARGSASPPPPEASRDASSRASAVAKRPRSGRNAEDAGSVSTASRRSSGLSSRPRRGAAAENEDGSGGTEAEDSVDETPGADGPSGTQQDGPASRTSSARTSTSAAGIATAKSSVDSKTRVGGKWQSTPPTAPVEPVISDALVRVSSALIAARRDYTQKYIDRHVEKLNNRPDLRYWQRHIRSVMVDQEFELENAHEVIESYCSVCMVEKFNANATCWNNKCPLSPVYHKLTEKDADRKSKKADDADAVAACAEEEAAAVTDTPEAVEDVKVTVDMVDGNATSTDKENKEAAGTGEKVKSIKQSRSEKIKCQRRNLDAYLSKLCYRRTPAMNVTVDVLRLPAFLLSPPSREELFEVEKKRALEVVADKGVPDVEEAKQPVQEETVAVEHNVMTETASEMKVCDEVDKSVAASGTVASEAGEASPVVRDLLVATSESMIC